MGEFDRLLEKAAVPRRFGLAPVQTSDPLTRQMGHKKIFDRLDTKAGPARGVLGLDQFVEWAQEHVAGRVGKVPAKDVGLYNFILNCFVEADEQCEGRVTQDQFDKLLTRAASVPRHFGLAPAEASPGARSQMFAEMSAGTGYVTAEAFWKWTVPHVKSMIAAQKQGKGWRESQ